MNVKRVIRLLRTLQMLQSGDGQNIDGMAEACGVSRRTAFRDVESLREAGVPVEFDRANDCYSIPGAYFLPPTNFTAEEALALIGMTCELGRGDVVPFYEPARRAALKLESSLPTDMRTQVRDLVAGLRVMPGQVNRLDGRQDTFDRMLQAKTQRRRVYMRYNSLFEQAEIETELRPYQLMFDNRSWYVVGRSSVHKEVRTFNISRVLESELRDESFPQPKGFTLERYLGNAWRIMPESGPDHNVHVRFKPMVASNVAEVNWHKLQRLEWLPDGSLDFFVTVSGLYEISWWILGYGDQAEVLKPAKLRRLVAGRVANMAETYRNGGL